MVGCTQGNWGLSVTVIDTCGLPVIREHPGRSHVPPPTPTLVAVLEAGYADTGAMGVMAGKSKGTGV